VDVVLGQGALPAAREVLLHHLRPGRDPPSSRISGTLIAPRPQGWILPWISTS
jgi:hypothetical protein